MILSVALMLIAVQCMLVLMKPVRILVGLQIHAAQVKSVLSKIHYQLEQSLVNVPMDFTSGTMESVFKVYLSVSSLLWTTV